MTDYAAQFLSALFAEKPPDHHILIWELNRGSDTKRNNFFKTVAEAAAYATKPKADGTDVYFCVSTLPKLPRGRGKLTDILGIGSVHLDVDIQNAKAHKKQNLPATLDEAIAFVNSVDLKPSILISSGYGLHAYWLLKDFVQFSDDAARVEIAGTVESWQKLYKYKAGLLGYDVDATQDLTRVLRVPGTQNWKDPLHPAQATILHIDTNLRYSPAELLEYLAIERAKVPATPAASTATVEPKKQASQKSYNDIKITIDEAATIDADTFEALCENIPKFRLTWQRKRKDLQDTSGSSYDMALANMVVAAGLDDQTTVNLLIAHRRKHNDEKPRLDYYQRTLAEASNKLHQHRERAQAAAAPSNMNDKASIQADLYTLLGFDIVKIEKQLSEPPAFILYFGNGKIKNMGNAKGLLDQHLFREKVADTIGRVVKQMKMPLWESTAQKMFDLAIDVEVADEATELGELREMLTQYLAEQLLTNSTEKQHRASAARHQPAVISGKACVHALELWKYAKRNYGYKHEKKHLIGLLKRLNAPREVFNVRDDRDKQHSVSVYCLPEEWLPANAVRAESATDTDEVTFAGKRD